MWRNLVPSRTFHVPSQKSHSIRILVPSFMAIMTTGEKITHFFPSNRKLIKDPERDKIVRAISSIHETLGWFFETCWTSKWQENIIYNEKHLYEGKFFITLKLLIFSRYFIMKHLLQKKTKTETTLYDRQINNKKVQSDIPISAV